MGNALRVLRFGFLIKSESITDVEVTRSGVYDIGIRFTFLILLPETLHRTRLYTTSG